MGDRSAIEWTDATWNPIVGCTIVSPGCTHCYAMGVASRLAAMSVAHEASHGGDPGNFSHYRGTTVQSKAGPVWTGKLALAPDSILTAPLRWRRPRKIFVNSMGDLFHEDAPDEWIDLVFAVMALAPQHSFQVLTKRSARMRAYLSHPRRPHRIARACIELVIEGKHNVTDREPWPVETIGDIDDPEDVTLATYPLPNVWLGVSTEDQARAAERIPDLLATPAAVRFISAEPLLGPLDLLQLQEGLPSSFWLTWLDGLDWVIVGGESGPRARPMSPHWIRSLRDQCLVSGTAFFFKQWGEWGWDIRTIDAGGASFHRFEDGTIVERLGKRRAGRLLDQRTYDALPAGTP